MKTVLVNGSSKTNGNTAFALNEAARVLSARGVEVERIDIGRQAIHGCIGCGGCAQKRNRECVQFKDDPVNGWIQTMIEADGMIIGSPVYYSGMNGALKSFLDRAFFVASANGSLFRHKVGAGVAAVRRAGSIATLDQILHYFTISEMFVPGGNYWTEIHGRAPGEAAGDPEGLQCIRTMAENMAWLLRMIEQTRSTLPPPAMEEKIFTNFIR